MRTPLMSFFVDSSMTRHFSFENSTMKSWSHIWLMLNRFTLRPFTNRTFAISSSLGREMILFPLIYDLLPSSKVTLPPFLDSKTLKRSVSSHVSWVAAIKVPQTRVHNLKCKLHHKAHFVLRWQINENGVFSHLPFMS